MADIVINNASFTHAYRKYAVEQGHDPSQAAIKSSEATDHTVSVNQLSKAITVDTVVISPAAQQAYTEQNLRTQTVNRRGEARSAGGALDPRSMNKSDGLDPERPR